MNLPRNYYDIIHDCLDNQDTMVRSIIHLNKNLYKIYYVNCNSFFKNINYYYFIFICFYISI